MCRWTMSISSSNSTSTPRAADFSAKLIDEIQTFGTQSLPMTQDDLGTRYRALWDIVREASMRTLPVRCPRGRGFCSKPSDMSCPQDFWPSGATRASGKARANEASWPGKEEEALANFEKYSHSPQHITKSARPAVNIAKSSTQVWTGQCRSFSCGDLIMMAMCLM